MLVGAPHRSADGDRRRREVAARRLRPRHAQSTAPWLYALAPVFLQWLPFYRLPAQTQPSSTGGGALLRGTVVSTSGAAIPGADVWLIALGRRAETDSGGVFRLEDLGPGPTVVQIRRLGYLVRRDTLTLPAEGVLVRRYVLDAQLAQLDTIRTVSEPNRYMSPALQSFESRRRSNAGGHFISDSLLRRNETSSLPSVIAARIPGVSFVHHAGASVLISTRKQCRGPAFRSCPAGPDCYVSVYMDGVPIYLPQAADQGGAPPDIRRILVSDLAGVEFYAGGASAPIGLHSNDNGCGTVWLWTREK